MKRKTFLETGGLTPVFYMIITNPVSYIDPFGLSADGATWWQTGLSFGADALSGVGTVKGIQEGFMGVDLITGQQLSVADRIATGRSTILIIGMPGGKVFEKVAIKKTIDGGACLIGKVKVNEFQTKKKQNFRLKIDLQLFAEGTEMSHG